MSQRQMRVGIVQAAAGPGEVLTADAYVAAMGSYTPQLVKPRTTPPLFRTIEPAVLAIL